MGRSWDPYLQPRGLSLEVFLPPRCSFVAVLFSLVILVAVYRHLYEVPGVPGPVRCRKGVGITVVVLPFKIGLLVGPFRGPSRVPVHVVHVDVVLSCPCVVVEVGSVLSVVVLPVGIRVVSRVQHSLAPVKVANFTVMWLRIGLLPGSAVSGHVVCCLLECSVAAVS